MAAEILPTLSPKFNNPAANALSVTVKFNQLKKVRSLAKKTLGSTLVGRAIRLPAVRWSRGCVDMVEELSKGLEVDSLK